MREIKFRGKDIETGEWIFGDLIQRLGYYPAILTTYPTDEGKIGYAEIAVKEDTVGQYTGMTDKNGKEIYEWDKLKVNESGVFRIAHQSNSIYICGYVLLYMDGEFAYYLKGGLNEMYEVVGNVYDNPELLKE